MSKVGELRTIIFPKNILVSALTRECVRVKRRVPRGTFVSASIMEDEGKIGVLLEIETAEGDSESMEFDSPFIAASLMRYCFTEKILLPRKAHKSLVVHGDSIALMLRLNMSSVDASLMSDMEVA